MNNIELMQMFTCCYLPATHLYCHIGTYDIQQVSVAGIGGVVNVSGQLANNTDAQGCFIIVKSSSSNSAEHYQIALNENNSCVTNVSNLEKGTHSVLMYDLERDGLPGSIPAVSMKGVVLSKGSMGY